MHQFLEKGRWKQSGLQWSYTTTTTTTRSLKRQIMSLNIKIREIDPSLLSKNSNLIFFSLLACTSQTRKREVGRAVAFFSPQPSKTTTTTKSAFHLGSTSKQANLVKKNLFICTYLPQLRNYEHLKYRFQVLTQNETNIYPIWCFSCSSTPKCFANID